MNKAQLIDRVSLQTKTTKAQSDALVSATLEIIQRAVSKGDEVKIVGFGTFSASIRKARTGRNPKTGQAVPIPGAKVPRFKAGKEFRDRLK